MSTKTKTLAKSLHTITVLVEVARLCRAVGGTAHATAEGAIEQAAAVLGYAGAADPYGLKDKAAAALEAGK